MKAPLWKLEGIASGTHYTEELLRFPLNTAKGGQGTIHNMHLQNIGQISKRFSTYKYIPVYTGMYMYMQYLHASTTQGTGGQGLCRANLGAARGPLG